MKRCLRWTIIRLTASQSTMVDEARRLEDRRLEVRAALEKLTASVSEATLLYTQASLALDEDEERERRLRCS